MDNLGVNIHNAEGGQKIRLPFAEGSELLYNLGLSIIPINRNTKTPLIKWKPFQEKLPSKATLKNNWLKNFGAENIAILTGEINNITIVDCDNPYISYQELELDYGQAEIIVKTPSGGHHLYYAYNGEKSLNGFEPSIDIKAKGGYVIIPPSYSDKGYYQFVRGNFDEIKNLGIAKNINNNGEFKIIGKVGWGMSYNAVFKQALNVVSKFEEFEELRSFMITQNQIICDEPLENSEVHNLCKSVWKYKNNGCLMFNSSERYTPIIQSELEALKSQPRALLLLGKIRLYNEGLRSEFNIPQKHMAKELGWSLSTLNKYLLVLVKNGFLKITRKHKFKELLTYSLVR
jgi:hypothetical protein